MKQLERSKNYVNLDLVENNEFFFYKEMIRKTKENNFKKFYELCRKKFNIPDNIDFSIYYKEFEIKPDDTVLDLGINDGDILRIQFNFFNGNNKENNSNLEVNTQGNKKNIPPHFKIQNSQDEEMNRNSGKNYSPVDNCE